MQQLSQEQRDRLKSGVAVAALHALLGYAFLTGLGAEVVRQVGQELKLFEPVEEPPPPPAEPPPPEKVKKSKVAKPKDPEGAAAPPNLKDTPTEIMAPPPEIKLPVPPPVVTAPVAGQGNAESAGAAQVPGPGTGRGGIGNGLGSGQYGNGTGGGGGGLGGGIPARWLSGRIRESDYPRSALSARRTGTVYLRFVVAPTGRVSECQVTRSSGSRDLDSTTCRLIVQRFRYRPARDGYGNPVAETIRGEHVWELGPEPPPIEIEGDIPEDEYPIRR
jgi:protein TonB